MKNLLIILVISIIAIGTFSCNTSNNNLKSENITDTDLLADTIYYPVRIKNIDPDDSWADIRLKKLDRKKFVDNIFNSVYSGKAIAYNYLTDRPYTIDEIKELENSEDYNRDNVVEIEFREKWWYNPDRSLFKKEVLSMLVAYAVFDDTGEFSRLKAAFYIKIKN